MAGTRVDSILAEGLLLSCEEEEEEERGDVRGKEGTQLAFTLIPRRAGIPVGQMGKPRLPEAGDMPGMLEAMGLD